MWELSLVTDVMSHTTRERLKDNHRCLQAASRENKMSLKDIFIGFVIGCILGPAPLIHIVNFLWGLI